MLGSVMTARNREVHPGSIGSMMASLVARCCVLPPATSTTRPSTRLSNSAGSRATRSMTFACSAALADRVAASRTAFSVRGARQTRHRTAKLHRRCGADVGARRHRRDMGRIENIGPGARRMGSGGSDVTDDGNGGSEHIGDDLAHAGIETARCIQAQNDNLGMPLACLGQSVLHIAG